ncbi:MAG: hypothetical protein [Microvirus sp.]|nr:MAG: hypothetical protein [Microvirus sp.]
MYYQKRRRMSRGRSRKTFRRFSGSKRKNVMPGHMRGGIRL